MLSNTLPKTITQSTFDHLKPGQDQNYVGKITFSTLSGLSDVILNSQDELTMQLSLGKDEDKQAYIKGQLSGQIEVQCQRCLRPMPFSLEATFCLSPVEEDDPTLSSHYEPIQMIAGELKLEDLVTEEILLNMPMIPSHPVDTCEGAKWIKEAEEKGLAEINPFKVLKQLK